jgi:hypothetical protein
LELVDVFHLGALASFRDFRGRSLTDDDTRLVHDDKRAPAVRLHPSRGFFT